jgi:methylmalonyl-CoA mutase
VSVAPLGERKSPLRIVTAASLFDGHDASINIMRRLLQAAGAEVIHLGHDRSVDEIATAAVQEDADAVAISSYQGGHLEFFQYLVDRLRELGAPQVRVYGGGGGTIVPSEIEALQRYGVARIFSPEDGRQLGLEGMIRELVDETRSRRGALASPELDELSPDRPEVVARCITVLEETAEADHPHSSDLRARLGERRSRPPAAVVGITGTGGAGKSSLVDELVRRFRLDAPRLRVGLVLVDPSRRRSGGALLGDRLRMNALSDAGVFARSLATRQAHLALSAAVADAVRVLQAADFDLVLVETAGIGQSDSEITDQVDLSLYVMTPEFGAPSQLEKIDMLDFADLVVLNKSDRHGAEDALRDVRKQWRRNHARPGHQDEVAPVFATVARRWNDAGTERLYEALRAALRERGFAGFEEASDAPRQELRAEVGIPSARSRYLAEIADTARHYRAFVHEQGALAAEVQALARSLESLGDSPPEGLASFASVAGQPGPASTAALRARYDECSTALAASLRDELVRWPSTQARYAGDEQAYEVRGRAVHARNHVETLSGTHVPRVALPQLSGWADLVRYFGLENRPGVFPFTAGVFPFKRAEEEPTRMFAGEGDPERTNRRFHLLCAGRPAARLSTAFDSVTLYGRDPDERPDIYGKVGTSGVSVCTLDDAKKLYSGFDLVAPSTSVSMTINGPAPTVLAFFLNAAIDQGVEKHLRARGELEAVRARAGALPGYRGALPEGHDELGLGLLGLPGDRAVPQEVYERIRDDVLAAVRGTVQADILKEDQAQNTCIFSTDFALKMMGDVQAWFIEHGVRNFYSVSISGYHMAEAGANPITQLAFTLANAFTYCEYYLARGMQIDAFAPSLSFFFSNGLDAEYSVIGRVARRIWAVAMRERYGASERSQKLKYHVQTSGRSLHAQEMAFNDIRTTLQALTAVQDHCNSLHTNAFDEAVTTPTEESVRRALAIQLIIQRELGTAHNENPLQGSYLIDELTDRVEEAVLQEFERLSERGGVLGAMETQYQRGRIQDESLRYESRKHSGELPVVGVNTFVSSSPSQDLAVPGLVRATEGEKRGQIGALRAFHARHAEEVSGALDRLERTARAGGNVFGEVMEAVKVASLGEISATLFDVGGRYRRAM